jgi:hypothetical protein
MAKATAIANRKTIENAMVTIPKLSLEKLCNAYSILLKIEDCDNPAQILLFINSLETIIDINIRSFSWTNRMELMYIIRNELDSKLNKIET